MLRKAIDRLAQMTVVMGYSLHRQLAEANCPEFEFLKHPESNENHYYRWRVYSYLMGDGDRFYRQQPYRLQDTGKLFFPPKQRPPIKLLTDFKRTQLANLLHRLSTKKHSIQATMVFALKHHQQSIQITIILCQCLKREPQKALAYFYLFSDILHNSLMLQYPCLLKSALPGLLSSLNRHLPPEVRTRLASLFEIWRNKVIYEDDFLDGLGFMLDDSPIIHDIPAELLQLPEEEIANQCRLYGLPRDGHSLNRLAKLHELKRQKKVKELLGRDGPYDGTPLSEQDLQKIRGNTVKVVTYHPLEYLNKY